MLGTGTGTAWIAAVPLRVEGVEVESRKMGVTRGIREEMDTYCGAWLSRGTRVSRKAHGALRREREAISSLAHSAWPSTTQVTRRGTTPNTSSTFDQGTPILKSPQSSKPTHEAGLGDSSLLLVRD